MNIKRSHIIIAIILFLALIGTYMLLSRAGSGTLELTAPEKTPGNVEVSVRIVRDGQEEQALTLRAGETKKIRVGEGTVRVDGEAGSLRAVDILTIKGFSTTKLETPVGEQRAIRQLASDAKYCPAIVDGATYSYSCDGEGQIIAHTSNKLGNSLNSTLFDGTSFSQLQPLKKGFIGFYAAGGGPTDLLYIDLPSRSVHIVKLPEAIQGLITDQPTIAVTATPGSSRFALLFSQKNKAYVFRDTSDTKPIEIKPGEDVRFNQEGRRVALSFNGNDPVLYAGVSSDSGEGVVPDENSVPREEESSDSELPSYLFEYTSDGKLAQTIHVPDDTEAQGLYKLGSGFYMADQPYGFTFYQNRDDTLHDVYTIPEVGSWAIVKNKAYVEADGAIYEFRPGNDGMFSLRSVFASTEITVSALYAGPEGVVFTGLPDTSTDAPLNVYQLLGEQDKGATGNGSQNGGGSTPPVQVEPSYTGLDDLLEYGVTAFQVSNLRSALANYAASSTEPITSIALTKAEPEPHDRFSTSTTSVINFELEVNRREATLKARLEYFELSAIRLYLSNIKSGVLVYDSQVINHKEPPAYNPEPTH